MFAKFIKTSGESQVVWAARLSISTGHLSGLLSGKKLPSLELAVAIERATDGAVPAVGWLPVPLPDSATTPGADTGNEVSNG